MTSSCARDVQRRAGRPDLSIAHPATPNKQGNADAVRLVSRPTPHAVSRSVFSFRFSNYSFLPPLNWHEPCYARVPACAGATRAFFGSFLFPPASAVLPPPSAVLPTQVRHFLLPLASAHGKPCFRSLPLCFRQGSEIASAAFRLLPPRFRRDPFQSSSRRITRNPAAFPGPLGSDFIYPRDCHRVT